MSELIKTVSYQEEEAKSLIRKFQEHLGIHTLSFMLSGGERIEGIISEIGKDYICIIKDNFDIVVPIENIRYYSYQS